MAEYVARNGEEFQEVVKKQKQDDVRFAFLEDGHLFHEYYVKKKHEFITTMCCGRNESDASTDSEFMTVIMRHALVLVSIPFIGSPKAYHVLHI